MFMIMIVSSQLTALSYYACIAVGVGVSLQCNVHCAGNSDKLFSSDAAILCIES